MKKLITAVMALARVRALAGGVIFCALALGAEPVKVVFDTDMLTDFDDVGALACLHALADAGECEILATVSSTRGNASVAAVEVINGYYGRGDLPVGAPKGDCVLGGIAGAGRAEETAARSAEVFNQNNPKSFCLKVKLVGNFVREDDAPQDDVHRTTYKMLFPHVKAIITSLTVAANVPPIFFPDINIDGQSVYMMENPKKI